MDDQWNGFVATIASVLSHKDKHQRILGKIASEVAKQYNPLALKELAEDVKEGYGISVAVNTLKNYGYVYDKTNELNLPEDLSYRTLQYIASSGDPKHWAERIEKEGLSSAEVYHLIREEKGLNKTRVIVCPHCGKTIQET